jgi:MFS family permease
MNRAPYPPEESKQERKQLLKLQRDETLSPLGLLTAYALVVGTFIAFGVLASYSGHKNTLEIFFIVTLILVLAIPVGIVWYFLSFLPKKTSEKLTPSKQSRWGRFTQSSVGKFLYWFGSSRIGRLLVLTVYSYDIADAIRVFPRHPRLSLAMIVLFLALLFGFAVFTVGDIFQRKINKIWDILDSHLELFKMTSDRITALAEGWIKFIENVEPSHQEAHKSIVDALRAIDATTHAMADTIHKLIDDPSPESPNRKDDEKPK